MVKQQMLGPVAWCHVQVSIYLLKNFAKQNEILVSLLLTSLSRSIGNCFNYILNSLIGAMVKNLI